MTIEGKGKKEHENCTSNPLQGVAGQIFKRNFYEQDTRRRHTMEEESRKTNICIFFSWNIIKNQYCLPPREREYVWDEELNVIKQIPSPLFFFRAIMALASQSCRSRISSSSWLYFVVDFTWDSFKFPLFFLFHYFFLSFLPPSQLRKAFTLCNLHVLSACCFNDDL